MSCQVQDLSVRDELPCPARESGGLRCERLDPHDDSGHWVSPHTRDHDLAGNGWVCRDGRIIGIWTMG